uniref:Uncharacterized protein n=1 Tax=Mycena chlorophos TaxID=658473 RepID=A0ABQ0M4X8_MYCCL|nr:predicted protein [Mycena chlorophos]
MDRSWSASANPGGAIKPSRPLSSRPHKPDRRETALCAQCGSGVRRTFQLTVSEVERPTTLHPDVVLVQVTTKHPLTMSDTRGDASVLFTLTHPSTRTHRSICSHALNHPLRAAPHSSRPRPSIHEPCQRAILDTSGHVMLPCPSAWALAALLGVRCSRDNLSLVTPSSPFTLLGSETTPDPVPRVRLQREEHMDDGLGSVGPIETGGGGNEADPRKPQGPTPALPEAVSVF